MKSKRIQALIMVAALAVGYGGAAVYTALAAPPLPLEEITDWGDGDGLTRYVVTSSSGSAGDVLPGLESVAGVAHAQDLGGGRALVATDGLAPQDLSGVPGVAGVELDQTVPVAAVPSDPYVAQYGYHLDNTGTNAFQQTDIVADKDTDAPDSWPLTTGEGMVVAVIDTGYDSDHPDMAGALWNNPAQPCGSTDADGNGLRGDCHGWNWYANSADIDNGSDGEHGASVSGTVGARANNGHGLAGVAPDVTVMPLVIGGGRSVSVAAGAAAIRYAVDNGADVINASWGGSFSGPGLTELQAAVAYAAAHDVLFVAAAGNDGLNRDSSPFYPANLTDWNVITVGASTAADTVSDFSAYGASSVDLFAPGTWIASINNAGGYGASSGTSLSAPMVAAAAALYKSAMPSATAAELKAALFADVDRVPAFAGKSVTGGRLTLGRLTGTLAESVRYAFTSMTSPAGTVTPAIGVTGATGSGDYEVAIGLGMEDAGEIWALSQKSVTLDGVSVPTDDEGDARFDLGNLPAFDGVGLSPTMDLADGRYVLAVQLYRDGVPVGRTHAAPLLVGSAVPDNPSSGGSGGGSTPGGGTTPGGSGGGTTPGGSGGTTPGDTGPEVNPGPSNPTMPGGGTTPGGTTPGGTGPGSGTTPDDTDPDPDDGSTPGGGTTPGGSTPDGSTPGGSTPGGTTPGGDTTPGSGGTPGGGSTPGSGSTPGGGTTPGGSTTPSTPPTPGDDTTTYPSVGAFRITSLSPNTVDTVGGARVTISGAALPAGAKVRVGNTSGATVLRATTTRVSFRAPARVAGTYDVTVFAPDGRSTVLSNALTYVDGLGTAPDDRTPDDPGTDGSTPDDGTTPGGSTPGGSTPGGSTPGGSTPDGSDPDGSGGSGATPAEPVVRTGPSGERLVRSARFSALGSIWSMSCSASCTGVAI